MADSVKETLLRQHVAPPRPVMATGAGAIENLLAVALPRSADRLLDMQVDIQSVSFGMLDQTGVVASLTENDLICRISGVGLGFGLIVADTRFLSALIEVQTLGKVTSALPSERLPTNTDVTFVSDILDQWLKDIAHPATEQGLAEDLLPTGYARDAGRLDLRAVELALDPCQYRSLTIAVEFGEEAKLGKLSIYTPIVAACEDEELHATLGRQLRPYLLDAPVEMTAVLARESLSLEKIAELSEGDVFPLPEAQLQSVRLEVEDRKLIATARLGQAGGKRAVRPWGEERQQPAVPHSASRVNKNAPDCKADAGTAAKSKVEASLADRGAPKLQPEPDEKPPSVESLELPDPQPADT
ncbi:MAG: FliM/FliN family flagellar motor switch protein [Boseongicola sp.]